MRDRCRRIANDSVEKSRQKLPRTGSGKWTRVRVAPPLVIVSLLTVIMPNVAGAMEVRVIYRCKSDSGTTFSDRPCDHSARPYQPDDSRVSSYAPDESSSEPAVSEASPGEAPRSKPGIRQKRATSSDSAKLAAACERLNERLHTIRQKMRSGYKAGEGERLRERKAKLETRRRAMRCR